VPVADVKASSNRACATCLTITMGEVHPLLLGHFSSVGTAATCCLSVATENYIPLLWRRDRRSQRWTRGNVLVANPLYDIALRPCMNAVTSSKYSRRSGSSRSRANSSASLYRPCDNSPRTWVPTSPSSKSSRSSCGSAPVDDDRAAVNCSTRSLHCLNVRMNASLLSSSPSIAGRRRRIRGRDACFCFHRRCYQGGCISMERRQFIAFGTVPNIADSDLRPLSIFRD
jgi:hypothetical protein